MDTGNVESVIHAAATLAGALPDAYVANVVSYQYTITRAYPGQAVTVTLYSGALPTGLSISTAGLVTGTYTVAGTFTWTLRITDECGQTSDLADSSVVLAQPVYAASSIAGLHTGPDYTTWTSTAATGLTASFVESRGGRIFHISSVGTGKVSTDGITWVAVTGLPSLAPKGLVYAGGKWFLFFSSGTLGYVSTDGVAFTSFTLYASSLVWDCAVASGTTIIVGTESIGRRSTDSGATWSDVTIMSGASVRAIAASPTAMIAVAGNVSIGTFRRSLDGGATWSAITSPSAAKTPSSVAYGGGRFVVVFTDGWSAYSTDDGATWTNGGRAGTSTNVVGPSNELTYAGAFVVGATSANDRIYSSQDAVAWTVRFTNNVTGEVTSLTPYRAGQ